MCKYALLLSPLAGWQSLLVSEVNLLKRLRHANIVKYYDRIVDWQQATLYIIMEFCEAGDLGRFEKKKKKKTARFFENWFFAISLIKTCKQERSVLQEDVIWNIIAQVVAGKFEHSVCGRSVWFLTTFTLVALKHCHSGTEDVVLHRDIKPGNIFLDASGNIKLGDFGLARVLSADSQFAQTWVGTPFYMSPV
jgi:serine/threonine protein kinase